MTHSIHFIYGNMVFRHMGSAGSPPGGSPSCPAARLEQTGDSGGKNEGRKEGRVLFNDAFNTFYLRFYGIGPMVKDHSDSERGNVLLPHGLLFPISSKGGFICIIPPTGYHIPWSLLHQS